MYLAKITVKASVGLDFILFLFLSSSASSLLDDSSSSRSSLQCQRKNGYVDCVLDILDDVLSVSLLLSLVSCLFFLDVVFDFFADLFLFQVDFDSFFAFEVPFRHFDSQLYFLTFLTN